MDRSSPRTEPPQDAWPRLVLRRTDQAVAAACLACGLAVIAGWWAWQGQLGQRLIDIDRAEPVAVETKIDINTADWPELTLLPRIGEQLAKRIVADRQQNGPFRDIDDLQRVRGIGPRTVEQMRPYLLPLPDFEATAENAGDAAPAVN